MLYDPKWTPPATEIKIEPWQQLLSDAADILQREGWIQRAERSRYGFCAMGAIFNAQGRGHYSGFTTDQAMAKLVVSLGMSVPRWNDDRKASAQQVISKLREISGITSSISGITSSKAHQIIIDSSAWTGR